MKDPVLSHTYSNLTDNLPNGENSKQQSENQNFSQYQQIPNFSDKKNLSNNQYFGISTVNNQLDFKIAKSIEIDISQLKFEKKLGEGNFGVVFQAKFNSKTRLDQNNNNNPINQNEEIVACKLLKSKNSIGKLSVRFE